jgi:hypothetical protein
VAGSDGLYHCYSAAAAAAAVVEELVAMPTMTVLGSLPTAAAGSHDAGAAAAAVHDVGAGAGVVAGAGADLDDEAYTWRSATCSGNAVPNNLWRPIGGARCYSLSTIAVTSAWSVGRIRGGGGGGGVMG